MNDNTGNSLLFISCTAAPNKAEEPIELEFETKRLLECNKKNPDLFPASSNQKSVEEDDGGIPDQEAEGVQKRDLLSPSSSQITFSPIYISGRETDLKGTKNRKTCEFLELNIKKFLAVYCAVTPVASVLRQRIVLLLSIFVSSKMALEAKNTETLVPQVLLATYCCLGYRIMESALLYRRVNSRGQKVEYLFDLIDNALLAFGVFLFDLQYSKGINEWFMFTLPLLFLLEIQMYRKLCSIAQSEENDKKVAWRGFCSFQTAFIAVKLAQIINFKWKETLALMWSYASIHSLYAPLALLLLLAVSVTAFRGRDARTIRLLKSRVFGYIWNICFNLLYGAGVVLILGFSAKIDLKKDDTLELGLRISKILSLYLAVYSVLLFPILKKSEFNLFEDLGVTFQNQVARAVFRKKYSLVRTEHKNKRAFFLMVSPTYFSQLEDVSQSQFEEMMKQNNDIEALKNKEEEESLCYICENHLSNAILVECGHGGVCCKCVTKLIDQKNECMECRKAAKAIYKIENELTNRPQEVIVQAQEVIEIIGI